MLESARLDTVLTAASTLQWINAEEVRLPKGLFDVKQKQDHANGLVILIGLYDLDETEIEEELEALIRKKQKDQPGQSQFWTKIISTDLFSDAGVTMLLHPTAAVPEKHGHILPVHDNPQLACFTPPPEKINEVLPVQI